MQNESTQNKNMHETLGGTSGPNGQINLETSQKESQQDKPAGQLTPEDEQIVLDRLRQLGYID